MRHLKNWTLTLIVTMIALHGAAAFAVDTITPDTSAGQTAIVTWDWTSDGSGTVSGRTSIALPGVILSAWTEPASGGSAPTDNYDVTVQNTFPSLSGGGVYNTPATDLAASALLNRDTANTELLQWWPDTIVTSTGQLLITVTNAGAANSGRIILAVARNLRLQRGEGSVPYTTGSTGDILQYLSPGAGKWVTMGGDVEIANGGTTVVKSSVNSSFAIPLGVGYIGVDDTQQGTWNLYGDQAAGGGGLRFYTGATADTQTDYYDMKSGELSLDIKNGGGAAGTITAMKILHANGEVWFPKDIVCYGSNPEFGGINAVTTTTLEVGTADTYIGWIRAFGSATGLGGIFEIYNPADNDTEIDAYRFVADGDLRLESQNGSFGTQTLVEISKDDGETRFPYGYSLTTGAGANMVIEADGAIKRSTSSARYKKNIRALEVDPASVLGLQVKTYEEKATGNKRFGLIAEEVAQTVPELAVMNEAGEPDAVDYVMLGPLLLAEVQRLEARVAALEAKLKSK